MGKKQKWYCEVCMKYIFKRKDLHLLTEDHEINKSRQDREVVYKEYIIRGYNTLMSDDKTRLFSKALKKSVIVYEKLKENFERFYNPDSDPDSDDENTTFQDHLKSTYNDSDLYCDIYDYFESDDENPAFQDYVESRYNDLMKNNLYMGLPDFFEKRAKVYKLIETELIEIERFRNEFKNKNIVLTYGESKF